MANKRNSKNNMKQVYLIRRVVAVLIIILILVAIFTKCSNKKDEKTNQNETQVTTNQNTEPNIVNGITDNTDLNETPLDTNDTNTEGDDNDVPEAIRANEGRIKNEYQEHANVEYRDNAFYFDLIGETKDLVLNRNEDDKKEEFKTFWDEFKYNLTKTSETLAETVEPGIEIHVVDPDNSRNTILLIKDGSTLIESVEI